MNKRIHDAFDDIHAEAQLKEKTMQTLREKVYSKPRKLSFARVAALTAALLTVLAFAASGLYFTPSAYIDLDVNPSLSMAVNRFGRIISADSLNKESANLLLETDLYNKPYDLGLQTVLNAAITGGYLEESSLISITLQTNDKGQEKAILAKLESTVNNSLQSHHSSAESEIYPVSKDLLETAHQLEVSPAKYIAISELQAVDETATVESCAHHSISELRERTQHQERNSHGQKDRNGNGDTAEDRGNEDEKGHRYKNNGNAHH